MTPTKFKICKKHKLAYITKDCPMCTGNIKVVAGILHNCLEQLKKVVEDEKEDMV